MAFKSINVREAHARQAEGYTYLDVRSVPEFERGHPAGAVNVPLLHQDERTGQMMPNRDFLDVVRANFACDAQLVVGCQAGGRSAQAAQVLASAGFSDVANVEGGFGGGHAGLNRAEGWAQAQLPIESGRSEGRGYDDLRAKVAEQGPVAE